MPIIGSCDGRSDEGSFILSCGSLVVVIPNYVSHTFGQKNSVNRQLHDPSKSAEERRKGQWHWHYVRDATEKEKEKRDRLAVVC